MKKEKEKDRDESETDSETDSDDEISLTELKDKKLKEQYEREKLREKNGVKQLKKQKKLEV